MILYESEGLRWFGEMVLRNLSTRDINTTKQRARVLLKRNELHTQYGASEPTNMRLRLGYQNIQYCEEILHNHSQSLVYMVMSQFLFTFWIID